MEGFKRGESCLSSSSSAYPGKCCTSKSPANITLIAIEINDHKIAFRFVHVGTTLHSLVRSLHYTCLLHMNDGVKLNHITVPPKIYSVELT